jgi:glutathione peroxidase
MKTFVLAALLLPALALAKEPDSLYAMKAKSLAGKTVKLSTFKGKVALVVNVASKCGFTPQYKGLEALYEKYSKDGFVVLGFPSNDFHSQEPGADADISKFCELNYGVKFPMFTKDHVTGEQTQPVYKFLKASPVGAKDGEIGWNFTKFLVGKDGRVAARFSSLTDPLSSKVTAKIEELLKAPAQ